MPKNKLNKANDWPQPADFKRSIRLEFSIYISVIIIVMMLVTGLVITRQYVKSATENVLEKLLVQARSYSGPAGKHVLSADGPDVLMLNNICKKLSEDNPDIYWVGVAGKDDVFLAHTDLNKVIGSEKLPLLKSSSLGNIMKEGEIFEIRFDTINIAIPILENGVYLGNLTLASSTRRIAEARSVSITTVVSITAAILLLGLPFSMIMLRKKLEPIKVITNHLKEISFDNFNLDIPVRSKNEIGYLAETLNVMRYKLNDAQKEMLEKERINREFEIAHEIQNNILPKKFPRSENFEFAGIYKSAKEIGGDYYDFIEFGSKYISFLVADVSGKSLPGMLVMLLTRDIVKRISRTNIKPADLLSMVNEEILPNIKKGMFVTMFYGILNKITGHFEYASAGHNPLIIVDGDSGKAELIKTKGFPLGMINPETFDKRIESGELYLKQNDWLIQYTDGVNEAQNDKCEEYGMERFVDLLKDRYKDNPDEMVKNFVANHDNFVGDIPQYDDITLLVLKWTNGVANATHQVNSEVIHES